MLRNSVLSHNYWGNGPRLLYNVRTMSVVVFRG